MQLSAHSKWNKHKICICVDPDISSLMFYKNMVAGLLPLLDGSNQHHKGLTSSFHSNDFLAFMSRSHKPYYSFNSSKEFSKLSHLPLHTILSHISVCLRQMYLLQSKLEVQISSFCKCIHFPVHCPHSFTTSEKIFVNKVIHW